MEPSNIGWYRSSEARRLDPTDYLDPGLPLYRFCDLMEELDLDFPRGKADKKRYWTRALAVWLTLNAYLLDDGLASSLMHVLSFEQNKSLRILREWWSAQYQQPELALASLLELIDRCDEITSPVNGKSGNGLLHEVLTSLQLARWPNGDIQYRQSERWTRTMSSNYAEAMQMLFEHEFHWISEQQRDLPASRMSLAGSRHEAMQWAYCQQAAMAIFKCALTTRTDVPDALRLKYLTTKAPSRAQPNLCPTPLGEGPEIQACGWLNNIKIRNKIFLPWYLWDRKAHMTVETSELEDFVDFTAISHTWGRWTKKSRWRKRMVKTKVAGVPWRVPENERFDVRGLPDRLDKLKCQTRYIWIDLFCIPQHGGPIMRTEIARQADIFKAAKYAVAWLNDVESLDCLTSAVQFMQLSLIDFVPSSCEQALLDALLDAEWEALHGRTTGLLLPQIGDFDSFYARPNAWFTSLWTLQELCLRPDMWLCTVNWDMAGIGDNQPLTIMAIVVTWNKFWHKTRGGVKPAELADSEPWDDRWSWENHRNEPTRSHIALAEISQWARITGLTHLTDLTPSYLLALGDVRACTSRRAEAIMSAIGATKWYSEVPESLHDDNLVLGRYPLAFIRELQSKDPVNFFASIAKFDDAVSNPLGLNITIATNPANRRVTTGPIEFHHIWARPRGSMLPLSEHGANYTGLLPSLYSDMDCHACVRDWVIRTDGRVVIKSACIVASSNRPLKEGRAVISALLGQFESDQIPTVTGEIAALDSSSQTNVDLEAWVHTRSFEVHAVSVGHKTFEYNAGKRSGSRTMHVGVIIARFSENLYVRLGNWSGNTKNSPPPEVNATEWLVA